MFRKNLNNRPSILSLLLPTYFKFQISNKKDDDGVGVVGGKNVPMFRDPEHW